VTHWLRIALAAQLAFFAFWGARLLTSHRDVAVVWLATEPVDPRDLLSGHYVALRYGIASAATAQCQRAGGTTSPTTVYVQLAASGKTVATAEGLIVLSEPVACPTTIPHQSREPVWIVGLLEPDTGHIVYGIERMFVGEDNALREARSGSVVAKVGINDQFEPRLLGLIPKATGAAHARQRSPNGAQRALTQKERLTLTAVAAIGWRRGCCLPRYTPVSSRSPCGTAPRPRPSCRVA
jgi:uncharacterized membrane-anchored protein